jgi:hypothetical protein
MKKRYLNLVLVALVALFAFAACSSGSDDDSLLSWPSDGLKDIGLKGLAPPSGVGITANGEYEEDIAGNTYYGEYVEWAVASESAYYGLIDAIEAKITKGQADGDITSVSIYSSGFIAVADYTYNSMRIHMEVTFVRPKLSFEVGIRQ